MECRREFIQLMFPRMVLISPLWQRNRNGWASCHDGNVLVEKRWWTRARADSMRSSTKSG